MAARCLFYELCLQPGQSYAEWIANLRGIGKDCQFLCPDENCGKSYLDSLIRDVLVTNTPDEQVRIAALQQPNPSLAQVIDIAEAHELAKKALATMKHRPADILVDVQQIDAAAQATKDGRKGSSLPSCPQCFRQHDRKACRFRSALCYRCSRRGHIAAVCSTPPDARFLPERRAARSKRKAVRRSPGSKVNQAVRLMSPKRSNSDAHQSKGAVHCCSSLSDTELAGCPA
ncbi:hypothetical protein M514_02422 [Trichuris suis]|uniref:CCHC-type domain-containing protein n=1 Tax=Trichuris suis TaxID=68888 RepID=A0A085N5Q7_9BILA|nr:hypothetical protein M513_02422 [Trichuris suis]KFD64803.1 hypothetical protein M514_02422 [Trichuris suis]